MPDVRHAWLPHGLTTVINPRCWPDDEPAEEEELEFDPDRYELEYWALREAEDAETDS
jgi:hypothetical protein